MRYPFTSLLAVLLLLPFLFSCKNQVEPPKPYGVLPTADQLAWQKMEYYMFVHFGPNTFTDVEWGNGKEDPKVFNPTDLDCRQWAATAKAAGMKGIIITAKHHDGFCLWPSKYSTHTVRESPWKDGKGDVLKELSEACKEYGLKFGVYLSPWDQNHPAYGTPEYNQIFANTLTEVLTQYGDIFEQWFDGANGEGETGKKQVYDWDLFHEIVYKNQPNIIIFSDVGPGCRWIGNESGIAGETNWSRLNIAGFEPGKNAPSTDTLNIGNIHGKAWVPGEADVSIRPGWFYSPSSDDKVKSLSHLMDIYYASVGRNANLLLNVPADRRGRIHANDSTRLMEFRKAIDDVFSVNLAEVATAKANATRGNSSTFDTKNLLDGDYDSYWTTNDDVKSASIELDLGKPQTFNRLLLQEYIPLGQRIMKFNVEYWNAETKAWEELVSATTVGYKRILRFPTVTTQKVKINIQNSLACPILNNVGLYKAPEDLTPPRITRSKEGLVTVQCASNDPVIYYTTDNTEPTTASPKYKGVFVLLAGGTVKAMASVDNGTKKSEVVTVQYDIAPAKWSVVSPKTEGVEKTIDGNYQSATSINQGDALVIDMGETVSLKGFFYIPVDAGWAANISRYNLSVSGDGTNWTILKNNAIFNNIKNNPIRQDVSFDKPVQAKYIKIEPLELTAKSDKYTVSELGIITK